jgi:5-methyltetrahydropteroyltriglutamate--homocysteine methyltransferase
MKPPFRADQVGSLLRPSALAQARLRWKKGALEEEAFRELEASAILGSCRSSRAWRSRR